MTESAVMTRLPDHEADGHTPFRIVELTGRGLTYACDLPGPSPDSPTIVLLHGLFATGNLNWSPFFEELTESYRVIAIDHRGHGRGIVGSEAFTLEACADDVAALLAALDTGPAIVVGYSMGGPIAQLVWRRHPDLVRGLVLCATFGRFAFTRVDDLLFPVVDRAGRAISLIPASIRSLVTQPALSLLVPDPERKAEVASALASHDLPSIRAAVRAIARHSAVEWLTEVSVPTAVIVTERDRVVPPARQDELVELIPDAVAFRIDADHLACFDDDGTFRAALVAACRSVAVRSVPANRRRPGPARRAFDRLRTRWQRWRARRQAWVRIQASDSTIAASSTTGSKPE